MSYRSKRTFNPGEEPCPHNKQPTSTSVQSKSSHAAVSQSHLSESSNISSQWGPFSPPTLGKSQTFGYISQPFNPSVTAEKPKSTLSSSVAASSVAASKVALPTLIPSKSQLKISSKPPLTPSQPRSYPLFQSLTQPTTQFPHKERQQPDKETPHTTKASKQPQKATEHPVKPSFTGAKLVVQPLESKQQPFVSPFTKTKSQIDQRVVSSLEAMKQTQKEQPTMSSLFAAKPLIPQANTTGSVGLYEERSPTSIHDESNIRKNYELEEPEFESESESEEEMNVSGGMDNGVKRTKLRRRSIVKNWPEHVKFDEEEEVLAYDADGKRHLVKGSVQPRDVWNDAPGFRYFVQLNEFNQPLHKGGSILVSFLGDIAKREEFCPVGILNWHKLNSKMRGNIVDLVRAHFLLPDGKEMRKAILKRTGKAWKNHRYALKRDYFDLLEKTREQNYASIPDGISTQNWTNLVDYWLSIEAQKFSEFGKVARASQVRVHKSGAKSFANRRAILKKKKGVFSELDFFKSVYSEGDGSFKEGTISHQFMEDAIIKVQENLASSSSSKPKVDIENEVFNQLMYQGEIPKRPLNYGFGVKKSDIFGVEGHLRKEGTNYVNNSDMEVEKLKVALLAMKKQNEDLAQQNQMLGTKFDAVGSMMVRILKETRSGNASLEVLDSAIQALDSQFDNDTGSNGKK